MFLTDILTGLPVAGFMSTLWPASIMSRAQLAMASTGLSTVVPAPAVTKYSVLRSSLKHLVSQIDYSVKLYNHGEGPY